MSLAKIKMAVNALTPDEQAELPAFVKECCEAAAEFGVLVRSFTDEQGPFRGMLATLATGTGKTVIAAASVERCHQAYTLVSLSG